MKLGNLRKKIVIQENQYLRDELNQPQRDAAGAPVDNWVDLGTVSASVEPLSGKEYFAAQQIQAESMVRFRIRFPGFQIRPAMRIKMHDYTFDADRYFDIQAVIDQNERHVEVWLMAVENIMPFPSGGGASGGSGSS